MKLEKVTNNEKATEKRWYDDACGTALAMELVGERWSLLIVRELMLGARRFGELKSDLPGISANVMTQRLASLERAGILKRRKLPPPASVQVYELTEWGYRSEKAIQELGRWAVESPEHDPSLAFSPVSAMLSFRTMIDRAGAAATKATVGFRFGADTFVARLDEEGITIWRDDPETAEVMFDTTPSSLASVVYGGRPIANAESAGELRLTGNRALAERFVTLFPLPAKLAPR